MNLRSIEGGRNAANRRWVCTYCGDAFPSREKLETHWAASDLCRRNRFVNNPTNSKYADRAGSTPVCACGHDGPRHDLEGGRCQDCVGCLVFTLAGFRD